MEIPNGNPGNERWIDAAVTFWILHSRWSFRMTLRREMKESFCANEVFAVGPVLAEEFRRTPANPCLVLGNPSMPTA
jgi:hypothetical protein